ncbi:MAG TPA: hypothetical protein VF334_14215 [Polyangia bacterium]
MLAPTGCGDTTSNTTADMSAVAVPHNFDQINSMVLQTSCAAFSVCHSADGAHDANMLNLASKNQDGTPNDPYAALVGVAAVNMKAAGEGKLRVKPCDSANSFLIIKLKLAVNEDLQTGYGHYMPDTNPHLDAAVIQSIADWIDRGALRNEAPTVTGKTCTLGPDMATHD